MLPALPGSAELRPAQDRGEPRALPALALLHDGLCAVDLPRLAAVPRPDRARAYAADASRLAARKRWFVC